MRTLAVLSALLFAGLLSAASANGPKFASCMGSASSVLLKGTPQYTQSQQNSKMPFHFPEAIVAIKSRTDVGKAIKCARQAGLTVCARSGGHSWIGSALCSGVTIDFFEYRKIRVPRAGRANVQAGAILGEVIWTLVRNHKSVIPVGTCASVGIAGFVTSGGMGTLSGMLGLGCDAVRRYTVTLANGASVPVTKRNAYSDLFYGLCGSATSNLAIVTDFVFQTYSSAPYENNVYFKLNIPEDKFADVLEAWHKYDQNGGKTFLRMELQYDNGAMEFFHARGVCWNVKSTGECLQRLKPVLKVTTYDAEDLELTGDPLPAISMGKHGTLSEFHTRFAQGNSGFGSNRTSTMWSHGSSVPSKGYFANMQEEFKDISKSIHGATMLCQWSPMGGKLAKLGSKTAFSDHRRASAYLAQYFFGGSDSGRIAAKVAVNNYLKPYRIGTYRAYHDFGLTNPAQEYYGSNANQLKSLKKKYDPDNLLESYQPVV